jgi:hypothetical protein
MKTARKAHHILAYESLEGFLRVCAWCRKIGHEDEWLPLEEYFDRHLDTKTTHAICPGCANDLLARDAADAAQDASPPSP